MRTLNFGLRVADLEPSLAFYIALGYEIVGRVPETDIGNLTMLKLPDDEFVTIELVFDPEHRTPVGGTGLSHFALKVESMQATLAELAAHGIHGEPPLSPDGSNEFLTSSVVDPDGNRIELVQWPTGHTDGLTAADFAR